MSNFVKVNVDWENLRSLAFGSIGAAYAAVGTGLSYPSRKMIIKNYTNQPIYVSTNGADNMKYMKASDVEMLDLLFDDNISVYPVGFTIYVKHAGAAPASGAVYVESMYGVR